ncbi:hypothetical protein PT974_03959 [Cladobotryum mycophilum]|uniref:HTH psq-type domain-containing protein n=1 Tax=Cladobotryum mycophilum TaxID=491253 RepID=A0ABR0STU4_9HYPO
MDTARDIDPWSEIHWGSELFEPILIEPAVARQSPSSDSTTQSTAPGTAKSAYNTRLPGTSQLEEDDSPEEEIKAAKSHDNNTLEPSADTGTANQQINASAAVGRGYRLSNATKMALLTLYGTGVSQKQTALIYGLHPSTVHEVLHRARQSGYVRGQPIEMEHVSNAPRRRKGEAGDYKH